MSNDNPLLQALGFLGSVVDTPGSIARGLLAGDPDRAFGGILDPERRVTGRQLLEKAGILSAKGEDEGFGAGDIAGIGAEMATDPLNFVGGALLRRLFGLRHAAKESNLAREALLAKGAMPEEAAALTKAVDETGRPIKLYHGTAGSFETKDWLPSDMNNAKGPGYYLTPQKDYAQMMADAAQESAEYEGKAGLANVREHYMDTRKPFMAEEFLPYHKVKEIEQAAGPDSFHYLSNYDKAQLARGPDYVPRGIFDKGGTVQGHNILDAMGPKNYHPVLKKLGYDAIIGINENDIMPLMEYVAHSPSQLYAPYIAPAFQRPPRVSPLLGALFAQNALRGSEVF